MTVEVEDMGAFVKLKIDSIKIYETLIDFFLLGVARAPIFRNRNRVVRDEYFLL